MEATEFREHLENNLIPFWNHLKDEENGGFFGYVHGDGIPEPEAVKGVILNNRILWFYSTAYRILKTPKLLEIADHAYRFLTEHCYDSRYGGVYWSVDYKGEAEEDMKHTYNQAFAIYALSAYYEASGRKEALRFAYALYHLVENRCKDTGGYLEAFNRDFSPTSNEKLSENGVMAERTMNTLLHVLEAYTELYRVDGFGEVGDSIRWILRLFKSKIYNSDKKICEVFFDYEYRSLIDLESYGHDIEASWLIDRACSVLNDDACQSEMRPVILGLAEAVYRNALEEEYRGLNNEREGSKVDRQKIWWVQAEAVVGFYNAYQRNPQATEYLEAAKGVWEFIKKNVIDPESGEWYESIPYQEEPDRSQPLVHPWKCPYHNGRMCMEMMRRLSQN